MQKKYVVRTASVKLLSLLTLLLFERPPLKAASHERAKCSKQTPAQCEDGPLKRRSSSGREWNRSFILAPDQH